MQLKWTGKALFDLACLYEFLAPVNKPAAARAVQALTKTPIILLTNPRIGEQLFHFGPREVRRILVWQYEIRYEIQDEMIYVLRLWHTREDRKAFLPILALPENRHVRTQTTTPPRVA
jgi:plasmid stabilization system protein ParE